jgi:hypothetical protein
MAVYFATAGGYVKVGYSARPVKRAGTVTVHGKRPCGVDLQRMTALAVIAADRHQGISREHMAAAGIPVEAPPPEELRELVNAAFMGSP